MEKQHLNNINRNEKNSRRKACGDQQRNQGIKMMTNRQLMAELEERDPEAPVVVTGDGEIINIDYDEAGTLVLMGEHEA